MSQREIELDGLIGDLFGEVALDRGAIAEAASILAQAVNEAVLDVLDTNQEKVAHLTGDEAETVTKEVMSTAVMQAGEEVQAQAAETLANIAAATAGEALGRA